MQDDTKPIYTVFLAYHVVAKMLINITQSHWIQCKYIQVINIALMMC